MASSARMIQLLAEVPVRSAPLRLVGAARHRFTRLAVQVLAALGPFAGGFLALLGPLTRVLRGLAIAVLCLVWIAWSTRSVSSFTFALTVFTSSRIALTRAIAGAT